MTTHTYLSSECAQQLRAKVLRTTRTISMPDRRSLCKRRMSPKHQRQWTWCLSVAGCGTAGRRVTLRGLTVKCDTEYASRLMNNDAIVKTRSTKHLSTMLLSRRTSSHHYFHRPSSRPCACLHSIVAQFAASHLPSHPRHMEKSPRVTGQDASMLYEIMTCSNSHSEVIEAGGVR